MGRLQATEASHPAYLRLAPSFGCTNFAANRVGDFCPGPPGGILYAESLFPRSLSMLVLLTRILACLALTVGALPLLGCELTAMTAASIAASTGSTLTTSGESWLTEDGLV